jgi:hypothetical protein
MKYIFTAMVIGLAVVAKAQQKITKATIVAKNEIQMESDGTSGMEMRGPGETKITTYIKDSMSMVEMENSFVHNITISNVNSGDMINLTEMQGNKTGYRSTSAEREDQRRRSDSAVKAGEGAPSGAMVMRFGAARSAVQNIEYTTDTKTINNIECTKAVVTMKGQDGEYTVDVWFTDKYDFNGFSIGGRSGEMFKGLKGLVIEYTLVNKMQVMGNEVKMLTTYQVQYIDVTSAVDDKKFEIPKGYKVKSYQEYIKDNPGGIQGARIMMRG